MTDISYKYLPVSVFDVEKLQKQTGYKDCAINLLVKYKLSIESVKTYPEITKIPFSEKPKKKPKISLD